MDAKTLRASLILRAMEGKLVPRGHERGADLLNEILSSEEIRCRPKNISKGILPTANFEDMLTVPDGWGMCRLGQISSVFEYGTPTKCHEEPADGDVIVLRMPNIQDGDVVFDKLKYANRNAVDSLFCKTGDILFNRTNSMELVGKCATVKFKQDNVSFASYLIRVHLVGMDPEFVSFFINSLDCRYKQIFPNATQQNGQANFSGGKLKNVIIPVPSLDEQRRIVDRLNELLPLVDKFGKAQEALAVAQKEFPEKLKASLLQEAIQGKLVPQLDEEPAVEQIGVAPEDVPFAIPEKWKWVQCDDVVTFNPRIQAQDETEASFIPMPAVSAGFSSTIDASAIKPWKQIKNGFSKFSDGDVLFAKITPCFQNRKSVVCKNLSNGIGAGSTEFHVLRPGEKLLADFLLLFLKSPYLIKYGLENLRGTAGQQRFSTADLKTCLFPLPPIKEQRRIVSQLNELLPLVTKLSTTTVK